MCDLLSILPNFVFVDESVKKALDVLCQKRVSVCDLLYEEPWNIHKRLGTCGLAPADVRRLANEVFAAMESSPQPFSLHDDPSLLSTGDAGLDSVLGGGFPTGAVVEIVGESGVGKTQLLLSLLLTAQLPPSYGGLGRPAIWIGTEGAFPVRRFTQLADFFSASYPNTSVSSDSVFVIDKIDDLEDQEHIIRYQLREQVRRANVGLVVIDSISANFRAEYDCSNRTKKPVGEPANGPLVLNGPAQLARRGMELVSIGGILRDVARTYGCVIVVANQVADHFEKQPISPQSGSGMSGELASFDFQSRWISGWDIKGRDTRTAKVPALGMVWAKDLAGRVYLKRDVVEIEGEERPGRRIGLAFANWTGLGREVRYSITVGGLKSVRPLGGN